MEESGSTPSLLQIPSMPSSGHSWSSWWTGHVLPVGGPLLPQPGTDGSGPVGLARLAWLVRLAGVELLVEEKEEDREVPVVAKCTGRV